MLSAPRFWPVVSCSALRFATGGGVDGDGQQAAVALDLDAADGAFDMERRAVGAPALPAESEILTVESGRHAARLAQGRFQLLNHLATWTAEQLFFTFAVGIDDAAFMEDENSVGGGPERTRLVGQSSEFRRRGSLGTAADQVLSAT
jgi:hypothetical protein